MPAKLNENMSLDDIIAANRNAQKKHGAGGKFFKKSAPGNQKQQGRPKFAEKRHEKPHGSFHHGPSSTNHFVKVAISNLAHTVKTADLQELFAAYNPSKVAVHFDDIGRSLYTADVSLRLHDARKLVTDFRDVALDGRTFKMAIADTQAPFARHVAQPRSAASSSNTASLQQQIATLARKVQTMEKQRTGGGFVHKKGGKKPLYKGKAGSSHKEEAADKKPEKTAEELDQELEAYMHKHPDHKHPEIVF